MTTPIRDFTEKREPISFRIDGDLFEAAPAIPAETLCQFAGLYEQATGAKGLNESYTLLTNVLQLVLMPASYTRLHERLSDLAEPIELRQISNVVEWLLEVYGLRPTQLPSPSSGGEPSPPPGTSSTESTVPAGSTFSPSPQTAS